MAAKIKIADVIKWAEQADKVFRTPLMQQLLLPALKELLPDFGVSPEDIAKLDAHYADMQARRERARMRAR